MTYGELKAEIAKADAKLLPDSATVTVNGAAVNGACEIELGKTEVKAGSAELIEIAPAFNIVQ